MSKFPTISGSILCIYLSFARNVVFGWLIVTNANLSKLTFWNLLAGQNRLMSSTIWPKLAQNVSMSNFPNIRFKSCEYVWVFTRNLVFGWISTLDSPFIILKKKKKFVSRKQLSNYFIAQRVIIIICPLYLNSGVF